MKRLLVALGLLVGTLPVASGESIPPIIYCLVDPWDAMAYPRALGSPTFLAGGISPAPQADFTVTILDDQYDPLPGLFVEVLIDMRCAGGPVIVCDEADVTGYTDERGQVDLNLGLGGCCADPHALEIRANGVVVRVMDQIVSPDWDGVRGNARVDLADLILFASRFSTGASGCTDLTGDGTTDLGDLIVFGGSWTRRCLWP